MLGVKKNPFGNAGDGMVQKGYVLSTSSDGQRPYSLERIAGPLNPTSLKQLFFGAAVLTSRGRLQTGRRVVMSPRIMFALVTLVVITTSTGAWTTELGRIDAVSAKEAQAIYGADGCYDDLFGSWCSDACGKQNGYSLGLSYKAGYHPKGAYCNDSKNLNCYKANWMGLGCL